MVTDAILKPVRFHGLEVDIDPGHLTQRVMMKRNWMFLEDLQPIPISLRVTDSQAGLDLFFCFKSVFSNHHLLKAYPRGGVRPSFSALHPFPLHFISLVSTCLVTRMIVMKSPSLKWRSSTK